MSDISHGSRRSPRDAGALQLVWPAEEFLPGFVDALHRGWSPDNVRLAVAAREIQEKLAADPQAYLAGLVDREARGGPIKLLDGTTAPRLPGYVRWLWDGEFCGSIGLRWQPGTNALPPTCLGHVGYSVVPWKQGRGYATRALHLLLPGARAEGLTAITLTTEPHNVASRRVIEANGGVLVEEFTMPPQYGSVDGLRFRIALP